MAKNVKVVVNQKAVKELERSDEVVEGIKPNAERVLEKAKADAPVLSGAYHAGLHLEEADEHGRRGWRVAGGTDHDIYVEAEHGTLAKSLDAAGGI